MTFFTIIIKCDLRLVFLISTINSKSKNKTRVYLILLLFLLFIKILIFFLFFETLLLKDLLYLASKKLDNFNIRKRFLIELFKKFQVQKI